MLICAKRSVKKTICQPGKSNLTLINFCPKNGGNYTYLAKYEFSEEDYDAMENGEFINEFEFKTEVINLNKSSQPCYRMIKIGPVYDEHGQIVAIEGYYLIEIPCNEDGNQNEENGAGDNEEGGNGNGDENNGPGLGWHWPDGHNFGNSNDPDFN